MNNARKARPSLQTQTELILGRKQEEPPLEVSNVPAKWRPLYSILVGIYEEMIGTQRGFERQVKDAQPNPAQREAADAATSAFDRDMNLAQASHYQELLTEVEDALKRIEDGTYGVCEKSGKPIPIERLRAIPWARYTKEAQEQIHDEVRLEVNLPPIGSMRQDERITGVVRKPPAEEDEEEPSPAGEEEEES